MKDSKDLEAGEDSSKCAETLPAEKDKVCWNCGKLSVKGAGWCWNCGKVLDGAPRWVRNIKD